MSRASLIEELHDAMRRRDSARTFAEAAEANEEVLEILDLLKDLHFV